MINLLSPAAKKDIRAGRRNVILLRYCVLVLAAGLFMGATFGVGFYLTWQAKAAAEVSKQSQQTEINKFQPVRNQAESFTNNLKTAKTILGSEIVFSKLLTDIAGSIPKGVVLSSLTLTSQSLGAPITIGARAANYQTAVSLKDKLEASPVFEQASIQNITQSQGPVDPTSPDGKYPVTVTVNAVLSKPTTTGGN